MVDRSSGQSKTREYEIRHFQFVIVDIEELEEAQARVTAERIAEAFYRNHAIMSVLSSFVVIGCLGVPFREFDSRERRLTLVEELDSELGERVKIGHGECDGIVGVIGKNWTELIPGLKVIREQLASLPPGTVKEF